MKKTISKLISERQAIWKTYQDSWDDELGDHGEYAMDEPKEIDELGDKIRTLVNEGVDELPVDFILESVTMLGDAPQMIYDDNGHFAFTGSGMSPVPMTDSGKFESTETFTTFIGPDDWFDTIREALKHYLEN